MNTNNVASHFLLAAPSSGSGKTTLTLGLLRALANRGLRVQPFKCGPDYIDTLHHTTAAGVQSINLDTFMASEQHVTQSYARYASQADVAVTEGVMGLFDGSDRMQGSSAAIAELLNIPVVLVINAKAMAYSVAPLLYGFKNFHKGINLIGVIFNFVSTESHYRFLAEACADVGVEALGYFPSNPAFAIPSRHLGLHISTETNYETIIQTIADAIPETIDIDRLLEITRVESTPVSDAPIPQSNVASLRNCLEIIFDQPENTPTPLKGALLTLELSPLQGGGGVFRQFLKISVARDEAFTFTYHQNIDVLTRFGEVTFFSPLNDSILPETDFLYLPGGYPELYAEALSQNEAMRESIRTYCQSGGLTYAECGGLMYLGQSITDSDGNAFPMVGVLNTATSMLAPKMTLGYRIIQWEDLTLKGHEFHYSSLHERSAQPSIASVTNAKGIPVETKLYRVLNTFASYLHVYWGDKPGFIQQLLQLTSKRQSSFVTG